jgi:hypothetical protein
MKYFSYTCDMLITKQNIEDNKEELSAIIVKFFEGKTETPKKNKAPKTVCHFNVLGKKYNSNIFVKNYENFLNDVSNIHKYDLFKKTMKGYVNTDINQFPQSVLTKSTIIKLNNGVFVSTYSATLQKMEHIKNICDTINVPVTFNVES